MSPAENKRINKFRLCDVHTTPGARNSFGNILLRTLSAPTVYKLCARVFDLCWETRSHEFYMDLVLKGNTEKFPQEVNYGGVALQTFAHCINDMFYYQKEHKEINIYSKY